MEALRNVKTKTANAEPKIEGAEPKNKESLENRVLHHVKNGVNSGNMALKLLNEGYDFTRGDLKEVLSNHYKEKFEVKKVPEGMTLDKVVKALFTHYKAAKAADAEKP